jgi:hypothetical protein
MRLLDGMKQAAAKLPDWFKRAAPFHVMVALTIMSYLTSLAPPRWTVFIRILNGYAIAGFLVFGYFRFGREARIGREETRASREELRRHRVEITALITKMMQDNADLREAESVRRDAEIQVLAARATEIAETVAKETKASLETTHQKLNGLAERVKESTAHAKSAYEVGSSALTAANSVNEKISEQNEAILAQQKAAQHIDEQMEQMLTRFDTVGERQQEIQKVVIDTGDIVRRELLERDDHTTRQQLDEIQYAAETVQQQMNKNKKEDK